MIRQENLGKPWATPKETRVLGSEMQYPGPLPSSWEYVLTVFFPSGAHANIAVLQGWFEIHPRDLSTDLWTRETREDAFESWKADLA